METLHGTNDLTEGVLWKKLLGFFFPILFGTLFQQLYNTVDAIIVGKFVGTQALAAVGGSAALVINLVVGFFVGLASGAMVTISQYFGAREKERLSMTVHSAVAFCLIGGAALSVLGIVSAPWVLRLVRTPEDTMADAVLYLRIYFTGMIPLLLFNIGSGILRAVGDSRRPLYYLIVCCVLNIALDILFVLAFKLGVAGVGLATVIALTCSAALVLYNLCTTSEQYRVEPKKIRLHGAALGRVLYLGIPAGIQSALFAISNLIIQVPVNELGSEVVAAWTATGKFDGVFWSISNSYGVAISAFVAQSFGAGKYDRMKRSVRVCMGMALATAAVLSVTLLLIAPYGLRLFSNDPGVIADALEMLFYFVPYYVLWSFIEVLSNSLRGAGDAVRPMVITLLGVCGFRVLWILLLVPHWHTIMGISLCYPASWLVTAIVFVLYYYKGNWLNKSIAALHNAERA